jgi:hypothetical protein
VKKKSLKMKKGKTFTTFCQSQTCVLYEIAFFGEKKERNFNLKFLPETAKILIKKGGIVKA